MRRVRALWIRLIGSLGFRGSSLESTDDDLRAELESHLEMQAAEYVRRGMSREHARRQALLDSGGVTRAAEATRSIYAFAWLENALADVRYALRGFAARPWFTGVVVATLALGVGVNVSMFAYLDRLFLRPPRYLVKPETVHRIYLQSTASDGRRRTAGRTEYGRYLDFLRWNRSMSDIAAFAYRRTAVGDGEQAREMDIAAVSASFFGFFDASPVVGRYFTVEEDTPPAGEPVAVLGFAYWRGHYGGSRDILGQTLRIGTVRYTIIGVAPPGFHGVGDGVRPIVFVPATTYGASMRAMYYNRYSWTYVGMLGRRNPNVSVAAANADLTNAFRLSWNAERGITTEPAADNRDGPTAVAGPVLLERGPQAGAASRVAIWIGGVAFIVLLVACANVANLLLARAVRRRREIAVRRAIGGTPARLLQQLLTESLVLAIIGSAAGLLGAWAAATALPRVFAAAEQVDGVLTDARTLAFAAALALLTAILAGLLPALQSRGGDLAGALKVGYREAGYRRSRTSTGLLLAQTAMSVVLLVGAGLFARSVDELRSVRLGYDPERLLYARGELRGTRLTESEEVALMERLVSEARRVPGVISATTAISVPFSGGEVQDLHIDGVDSIHSLGRFELQAGTPEYFTTMGTRILRGRGITAEDRASTPRVAVVSAAMAEVLWRREDALGKCFRLDTEGAPCTTVVGIAENIRTRGFGSDGEFHYYLPLSQYVAIFGPPGIEMFVRVDGDPGIIAGPLRALLQAQMPGTSYVNIVPFQDIIEPAMQPWTSGARMFLTFGGLALLLAAIGLYAVIAFAVAHRTQEIGIRIALGARMSNVLGLVLEDGLRVSLAGVLIGTVVALAASNRIGGLLFGVSPRDPTVYGVVAVAMIVVSAVACLVPALRAARVHPAVALRSE
jgi:predicted permease